MRNEKPRILNFEWGEPAGRELLTVELRVAILSKLKLELRTLNQDVLTVELRVAILSKLKLELRTLNQDMLTV